MPVCNKSCQFLNLSPYRSVFKVLYVYNKFLLHTVINLTLLSVQAGNKSYDLRPKINLCWKQLCQAVTSHANF